MKPFPKRASISSTATIVVFLIVLLTSCVSHEPPPYVPRLHVDIDPKRAEAISYEQDVQPLLDARCVSCHSCFDAPGQLKLDCAEGVVRGASKLRVYDTRLKQASHTRLHYDAQTEEEWRELGFFRVLPDLNTTNIQERLDSSVLYNMLALARVRRLPEAGLLDGIVRDSHDKPMVPTLEEFPEYASRYPHAGMPFYTYGLTEDEFLTLAHWIAQGAPVEYKTRQHSEAEQAAINSWETLLNGSSLKEQLTARYLFEHWFAANLYFDNPGEQRYFRIVRSRTPPGHAIDLIATPRPNDPPGVDRVYYRLERKKDAVMRKTHLPYALNSEKQERIRELFFDSTWDISVLPLYGNRWKERPFEIFDAIPERSRYQFLLDDSYYFVLSFMRGPVCRGQTALNVIRDHFFVMFVDPDHDPSCANPSYLQHAIDDLVIPSAIDGVGNYLSGYPLAKSRLRNFHALHSETMKAMYPPDAPMGLDSIWDGGGSTGVPYMTIFRHFDTASVVKGYIGDTPETAWLVDYSLLERIYYLLVVNFDVFGPVPHQLATRSYFDLLRYEGERSFLSLVPAEQREELFRSWYRGVSNRRLNSTYPIPDGQTSTGIVYQEGVPALHQLRGMLDVDLPEKRKTALAQTLIQDAYRHIPQSAANHVQYFPEAAFLRVRMNDGTDEVYTLLRNKALKNVAHLFDEGSRREPEKDSLVLVPGIVGDYPNFMMDINEDDVEDFRDRFYGSESFDQILSCWVDYGVLRNSPEFWTALDFFITWEREHDPLNAGRFDLKHYFLTHLLSLGKADLVTPPGQEFD